jgi:general secretion pathway protein D
VYVFKNARADVVANLLNTSFGNRTTNGPVGGSLTSSGASQPQVGLATSSSTSSGSPLSLGTGTGIGGGGGGGGAGGYGGGGAARTGGAGGASQYGGLATTSSQNNTATLGYDSEGHVTNIRSLYGEVLLVPNIDLNSVIVVCPPEDKSIVENILEQMDQIPKQVMIQTLIVETNLTKATQLGVEWSFANSNLLGIHNSSQGGGTNLGVRSGVAAGNGTTAAQGFTYSLSTPEFSAFLQALQTDTSLNVLSTPRIFTTNNATAEINISQSVPYETGVTQNGTGIAPTISYNYEDVGIVLTVTPRITDNGYVTMDISQTANDIASFDNALNGAPIVNQREAQTTVSVKGGQTIVLGGLIQNSVNTTVNKVPVLGDIPLIGNLFKSTNKTHAKTELLVFMTPYVVSSPEDAVSLRTQTESEMSPDILKLIPTVTASSQAPVQLAKPAQAPPPSPQLDPPATGSAATTLPPGLDPSWKTSVTVTPPGEAPPPVPKPVPQSGSITLPAGSVPADPSAGAAPAAAAPAPGQ